MLRLFAEVAVRDFLMLLYFLLLLPLWPFFYVYAKSRRQYWLRTRGYWVRREGRDDIRYEENRGGVVEHFIIAGEMMAVGLHVIYVPTEEEWRKTAPEWARWRRDEILERVRGALGSKNYEYVSS